MFLQLKLIKTNHRCNLSESSIDGLMQIEMESLVPQHGTVLMQFSCGGKMLVTTKCKIQEQHQRDRSCPMRKQLAHELLKHLSILMPATHLLIV